MVSGPEHYAEAERLLVHTAHGVQDQFGEGAECARQQLTMAQVHATLALAAATALCTPNADGIISPAEYNAWHKTAAVKDGKLP